MDIIRVAPVTLLDYALKVSSLQEAKDALEDIIKNQRSTRAQLERIIDTYNAERTLLSLPTRSQVFRILQECTGWSDDHVDDCLTETNDSLHNKGADLLWRP